MSNSGTLSSTEYPHFLQHIQQDVTCEYSIQAEYAEHIYVRLLNFISDDNCINVKVNVNYINHQYQMHCYKSNNMPARVRNI